MIKRARIESTLQGAARERLTWSVLVPLKNDMVNYSLCERRVRGPEPTSKCHHSGSNDASPFPLSLSYHDFVECPPSINLEGSQYLPASLDKRAGTLRKAGAHLPLLLLLLFRLLLPSLPPTVSNNSHLLPHTISVIRYLMDTNRGNWIIQLSTKETISYVREGSTKTC